MAITRFLSDLASSVFQTDQVAVFDQLFFQVFSEARAIKATVHEQAKVMEHPVESGAVITDHRVILPVEIELSLILASEDYQDVYRQIRQYYLNGTLLTVQTRTGIYDNQLIQSIPHEEDPNLYDAVTLLLRLKQVQFVTAQFGVVPEAPRNSTAVNRGVIQGATATASHSLGASTAFSAFNGATTS